MPVFSGEIFLVARGIFFAAIRARFVAFSKPAFRGGAFYGVQLLARTLALWLITTVALRADGSLAHARLAQDRLGPDIWSRIIRIENEARITEYPRVVFAVVFELAGILWFYTDTDGTQSFSLHQNRVAEEKADFGPLLRDIEPGFARWRFVAPDEPPVAVDRLAPLPNDCFIASVGALRALQAAGAPVAQPRLLSFYKVLPEGRVGHTVLTYTQAGGVVVLDPTDGRGPREFSVRLSADALGLARALEGGRVTKARWLPIELSESSPAGIRVAGGAAARLGVAESVESSASSPHSGQ